MSSVAARPSRHRQAAFTLLEVLLVLGLLIVLAAWTAPEWRGQLARARLETAAQQVKTTWQEARLHAIEDGIGYEVAFVPGSGHYRVRPAELTGTEAHVLANGATRARAWEPGARHSPRSGERSYPNQSGDIAEASPRGWNIEANLPGDAYVATDRLGENIIDDRASDSDGMPHPAEPSTDGWVVAAVFWPQGTATDASLLVGVPGTDRRRRVELRGLTGRVKITDVRQDGSPEE